MSQPRTDGWDLLPVEGAPGHYAATVDGVEYEAKPVAGGGYLALADGWPIGHARTLPRAWDWCEGHRRVRAAAARSTEQGRAVNVAA